MSTYMAYVVGKAGHYMDSARLDCADDVTAIKLARPMGNGRDVEVWKGSRKVASFKTGIPGEFN